MTHKLMKGENGRPTDELGCWMLKNQTILLKSTTQVRPKTENHVTLCAPVKPIPQGKQITNSDWSK